MVYARKCGSKVTICKSRVRRLIEGEDQSIHSMSWIISLTNVRCWFFNVWNNKRIKADDVQGKYSLLTPIQRSKFIHWPVTYISFIDLWPIFHSLTLINISFIDLLLIHWRKSIHWPVFFQCPIEWFHFGCVGLTTKPKGKWFCSRCIVERYIKVPKFIGQYDLVPSQL